MANFDTFQIQGDLEMGLFLLTDHGITGKDLAEIDMQLLGKLVK